MTQGVARERHPLPSEVVAWRRERLTSAGFAGDFARTLARDRRIDLHALIELTERGCPPEIAARILAPLELRLPVDASGCEA
jgi:hypothetical protein